MTAFVVDNLNWSGASNFFRNIAINDVVLEHLYFPVLGSYSRRVCAFDVLYYGASITIVIDSLLEASTVLFQICSTKLLRPGVHLSV